MSLGYFSDIVLDVFLYDNVYDSVYDNVYDSVYDNVYDSVMWPFLNWERPFSLERPSGSVFKFSSSFIFVPETLIRDFLASFKAQFNFKLA